MSQGDEKNNLSKEDFLKRRRDLITINLVILFYYFVVGEIISVNFILTMSIDNSIGIDIFLWAIWLYFLLYYCQTNYYYSSSSHKKIIETNNPIGYDVYVTDSSRVEKVYEVLDDTYKYIFKYIYYNKKCEYKETTLSTKEKIFFWKKEYWRQCFLQFKNLRFTIHSLPIYLSIFTVFSTSILGFVTAITVIGRIDGQEKRRREYL